MTCRFVIQLFDAYENFQGIPSGPSMNDSVRVEFKPAAAVELGNVTRISPGQYAVSYSALQSGGPRLFVYINGVPVKAEGTVVSIAVTDGTMGIYVGAGFFAIISGIAMAVFIMRQRRVAVLKRQWQQLKQAAYDEYGAGGGGDLNSDAALVVRGLAQGGNQNADEGITQVLQAHNDEWDDATRASARRGQKGGVKILKGEIQSTESDWSAVGKWVNK